MPLRKTTLTRSELARHHATLRELNRQGFDVELENDGGEDLQSLDIVIPQGLTATVFSGAHGVTIYEVWLSALARRPVEILDIDLETDFDADIVLENRDLGGEYWHLGGRVYPESTLLNPRFDPTLQFRHTGKRVEGILLATGLAPIPPEFRQGQSVPASLTFCDANCHTFKVQTKLYVDRTAERKFVERPRAEPLFGPGSAPLVDWNDENSVDLDPGRRSQLAYLRMLRESGQDPRTAGRTDTADLDRK